MRKILILVLTVAIVPASVAVAGSTGLKVTGGGQVVAGSGNGGGAGSTIAFNAQQSSTTPRNDCTGGGQNCGFPATGQLQVVDRTLGVGPAQVKFHGVVTCIRDLGAPQQGAARVIRFGGYKRGDTSTKFTVDVQDNGEPNQGNDMIAFRQRANSDDACDEQDEMKSDLTNTSLARGNVQDH